MIISVIFAGCIRNDIPYPVLSADILALEVAGQIGTTALNATTREAKIELADTIDPKKVKLLRLDISKKAYTKPELHVGDELNLTTPLYLTLAIHQDYLWQIIATQTIHRTVTMANQVGEAVVDVGNKMVLVNVAANQPSDQIQVLTMQLGPSNATITPDPSTVHNFTTPQVFVVRYRNEVEVWTVRVMHTDVNVITGKVNPWAKFAYLNGSYVSSLGAPTFEYRQKGVTEWNTLPTEQIQIDGNNFSTKLTGLTPNTTYEFRSIAGTTTAATEEFTTENTEDIPNLSFNDWYMDSKSWYADVDLSPENYWWDSGNKGANSLSEKNPTSPESVIVVEGKAAKLASTRVLSVFAAGSIYVGKFGRVIGLGAEIHMGHPYKARPTRLTGWYNYTSGVIDKVKAPYENFMGTQDSCSIYMLLSDIDQPYTINTTTQQFINFKSDPNIIAFGELKTPQSTSGYQPFTLNLEYRSLERKPKYVVLVGCASKYGDYFTGSTSSVLYLDQFKLEYD